MSKNIENVIKVYHIARTLANYTVRSETNSLHIGYIQHYIKLLIKIWS